MRIGRGSWLGFARETANDFFYESAPGALVAGVDHARGENPVVGGAQPAHGTAGLGLGRAPLLALRRKGISSRTVPVNEAATQALQRYLFARLGDGEGEVAATDPLFPSRFHGLRLTRWGANDIVHAVLAKAAIDGNADYGTHSLRKSFCRQIYKGTGNDLNLTRAVVGHSSCSTTEKYLHVDEEEIVSAIMGLVAVIGAGSVRLAQ